MNSAYSGHLQKTLAEIDQAGLTKRERVITTHQTAHIAVAGSPPTVSTGSPQAGFPPAGPEPADRQVLNLCANNYLGLADHPDLIAAGHTALDRWGYGLASVRFICGTQTIHKDLEAAIARFLGTDDTILYSSCFDANGGLFETLLGAEDAVISDELNHASIIDGIRLCKAQRHRYKNNDLADLETKLKEADAAGARFKLIATDGVFSMDGTIANLRGICDLADRYQALVMVDDSHAAGFMGATGRGSHEHCGVMGRVDVFTGTLGKALGGASGGYTSGRKEIIDLLRQRSRPYLFSNSIPPVVAGATLKCLELLTASTALRDKLHANTSFYREGLVKAGLSIKPGTHPIVPIMLGDAVLAQKVSARLLNKGLYAVGFFFPVVPQGQARIRTQVSAAHSREDLVFAINAFAEVKAEFGF